MLRQVTAVQADWRVKVWLLHYWSFCGLTAINACDRICCARDKDRLGSTIAAA